MCSYERAGQKISYRKFRLGGIHVFAVDLRKAARGEIQQGIPADSEAAEFIPDVARYFGTRKHLPA